jgi:hypothetical protein
MLLLPIFLTINEVTQDSDTIAQWFKNLQQHGIAVPPWLSEIPVAGEAVSRWWQTNLSNPNAASSWLGSFMAQGARELLGVLHEVEQRIHDICVTAWRREGIGLGFVNDEELEGMGIARLSHPGNRVRQGFQGIVEGRGFHDLPFCSQLLVHLLPKFGLLVGGRLGKGGLGAAEDRNSQ